VNVRGYLALATLRLFAVTIVGGYVSANYLGNWQNTKELLDIIMPVETLVLGGAVGFYFGGSGPTT
jgi:hypothetical protein